MVVKQWKSGRVESKDISVYEYGYTLMFETGVNLVLIFSIGLCFRAFGQVLIFLSCFMPLRCFAGGWHAKQSWQCIVVSNLVVILAIVASRFNDFLFVDQNMYGIEVLVFLFFISLTPIECKQKPLSLKEKQVYGRTAKIIFLIEMLFFFIIRYYCYMEIARLILCAHVFVVLSLGSAKLIQVWEGSKRNRMEECNEDRDKGSNATVSDSEC